MPAHGKGRGIIVGADGSPASDAAVRWAAEDAALHHLPLTVVHVINPAVTQWPHGPLPDGVVVWQENEGRRILTDALKIARDAVEDNPAVSVDCEMYSSATIPTFIDLSTDAELMVVGNHGRGALARGVLGSVSSSLVRHAHCPVAVIRDDPTHTPHPSAAAPVLVGIDGSPASKLATQIAFDEASRRRVNVVAVHAWSDSEIMELPGLDWSAVKGEEERLLAEQLAGWQERYPDVTVQRLLVCDRPARVLVETSGAAQLVVLGSHGRGVFAGALLGSVGNAVVQSVHTPVIVARRR
ncbi:universal stress protein [Mycobacterium cookii]|uniref:Universal stress protein n=1 Tax=Mycobacterium cookii TaxID=1775 RepID=A0A7I7KVQ2_9MYCO|nr:universal stress protein [Mycobacterium cookii]MCV7329979.1 universal stress protein [Mycobacterium cookii]BBX45907.1 universal stress protein [Mycobacterium cookii]